jgi:hypothetical protein
LFALPLEKAITDLENWHEAEENFSALKVFRPETQEGFSV